MNPAHAIWSADSLNTHTTPLFSEPVMQLTNAQIQQYQTFGYLILPRRFPPQALTAISAEAEMALQRGYGARPIDPHREQAALAMGEDTPLLSSSLEQPPLLGVARQLFGPDVLGIACYATSHVGDTGWHADSPHASPRGMKMSVYLQPTTATAGALRVIPGSHRSPMHDSVRNWLQDPDRGVKDAEVPAVVCPSSPGDMIVFDLRLFHAALGGGNDRRVINLFYYQNPTTEDDIRRTREQIVEDYYWLSDKNRSDARVFDPHWLANNARSKSRRAWIARFEEMGFFDRDQERTGRLDPAAAGLPEEMYAELSAALPARWSIRQTLVKSELAIINLQSPGGEIAVLVRPADDPRPRLVTLGPLAWGYSTLDCEALKGERLEMLQAFIERSHVTIGTQLREAIR